MGNEFQEIIDQENLEIARENLKQFTSKIAKKSGFSKAYDEIVKVDNENLDEMQLGFLINNPELNFDEILLVKKVFDYLKSV